jgi:hypothetical protein
MVGLECARLQPSMEDLCMTYFSDRKNIPQHGLYIRVTAARRGHLDKLTRSQAVEAMQSFFLDAFPEACRNPAGRYAYFQGQMKAAAWKG